MTTGLSTEILSMWAKRIAVEVEPEREAIAPMMLDAYLHGGRERRQLFARVPMVGGILPDGGASLLPYAYLALSTLAAELVHLCSGKGLSTLSDLLSCWKNWLELGQDSKDAEREN